LYSAPHRKTIEQRQDEKRIARRQIVDPAEERRLAHLHAFQQHQ
jgi:hypothetical protein